MLSFKRRSMHIHLLEPKQADFCVPFTKYFEAMQLRLVLQ